MLQNDPLLTHPGHASWRAAVRQLGAEMALRGVHPSRTLVVLPYAQLMQHAAQAWALHAPAAGGSAASAPRFETTMNWASAQAKAGGDLAIAQDDIRQDAAIDLLTAQALLTRAGLAKHLALAGRLLESSWSLCRVAAAQPPDKRLAWGAALAAELGVGMESPALALELALARIALAWAASSSYPSDVLFTPEAAAQVDLLVVLEGFQAEPVTQALKTHFADRALSIVLWTPDPPDAAGPHGALALHAAQDAEDEAQRAAACVLTHLAAGRSPVALVAQDRVLTRRVGAMLAGRGLVMRDETGWKLSTTRAAAGLMGLLRAVPWDATTDTVLDWLKNAPAFEAPQVTRLELALRKAGIRLWRNLPKGQPEIDLLAARITPLLQGLQKTRTLADWLSALRGALVLSGQWQRLAADVAGADVIAALRLAAPAEGEGGLLDDFAASARMGLQDFTSWANQTLEAVRFSPEHPDQAQLVILPLSQLLGRPLQAVVLPGADEVRLAVSPEPAGLWTAAQRQLLGLASRQETAAAQRLAWQYALLLPHVDVLWRSSEAGERLMPSGFVQELLLGANPPRAADPRSRRVIALNPTPQPAPTGAALPLRRLSASAYEDLRRCPYRFFALRQLKLQEADELDSELGKRDFGNWLHLLLSRFHAGLKTTPNPARASRTTLIDHAAQQARLELALTDSEFLPFAAIWPRVREGYLDWLEAHEAQGAVFAEGEVAKETPLGSVTLVGKLDRIDVLPGGLRMVMDYKTEGRTVTQERIKNAAEDTQLAFYAALLDDDTLTAAYINLGEKEATRSYEQPGITALRDQLIDSILSDMARIAQGTPLPALGEGKACEYCTARGLCRKDFWR